MSGKCFVHYDYNWAFRRDWVRDGIPWFILPSHQIEASTQRYNQTKLLYVRKLLKGTSKTLYLQDILDNILPRCSNDQDKLEAILCFVQDATWHNPLECPFEADEKTIVTEAHELLELHDARCWHTAEILCQLFRQAGWDARITILPSGYSASVQVITEVFYDGEWRFADANYFKNHVIVRKPDGCLPTVQWLREHPYYADRFPGGWIFPPEYLTNAAGLTVTGQFSLPFPEAKDTWGSDSYYCYYLGAEEAFPPIRPPVLRAERAGHNRARFVWEPSRSLTSQLVRYNLEVRRLRDGVLVGSLQRLETTHASIGDLNHAETYVATIRAIDEHLRIEPHTWYPKTECTFTLLEI